jgi:hypothetical protein
MIKSSSSYLYPQKISNEKVVQKRAYETGVNDKVAAGARKASSFLQKRLAKRTSAYN